MLALNGREMRLPWPCLRNVFFYTLILVLHTSVPCGHSRSARLSQPVRRGANWSVGQSFSPPPLNRYGTAEWSSSEESGTGEESSYRAYRRRRRAGRDNNDSSTNDLSSQDTKRWADSAVGAILLFLLAYG